MRVLLTHAVQGTGTWTSSGHLLPRCSAQLILQKTMLPLYLVPGEPLWEMVCSIAEEYLALLTITYQEHWCKALLFKTIPPFMQCTQKTF